MSHENLFTPYSNNYDADLAKYLSRIFVILCLNQVGDNRKMFLTIDESSSKKVGNSVFNYKIWPI